MRIMTEILDTSAETKWLLSTFERTLDEIQTRVVDEDGMHFSCFPFGWRPGNSTCQAYTSPVCVLCRVLNEGTWEVSRD